MAAGIGVHGTPYDSPSRSLAGKPFPSGSLGTRIGLSNPMTFAFEDLVGGAYPTDAGLGDHEQHR